MYYGTLLVSQDVLDIYTVLLGKQNFELDKNILYRNLNYIASSDGT